MKIIILLCTFLLLVACDSESYSKKVWNPKVAVDDARAKFKESGYSSIQIYDNEGNTYSGEKTHSQKIVQCVIENTDWNILAHKLQFTLTKNVKDYVSIYNTEMLTLRAQELDCIN